MKTHASERYSWKTFLRYAAPSVVAMLLFSLYTVVDGIFVAKGAGELAMTAVNVSLPFVSSLSGISVLIGMGTATLVAVAMGRGEEREANELFTQTTVVMAVISVSISIVVSLFAEPLARMLGAGPSILADTTAYLRIVGLFALCFIISYCFEVMVKVDGNPHMAVVGVGASFITNIGLDALFVLGFDWGVTGAAWATGIAQLVSLAIFTIYFMGKKSKLKLVRFEMRPRAFKRILPLGIADCSVEMIVAFLTLIYNRVLLDVFGESSLTVFAVVAYVNLFVFMTMQGVSQGMMHLVSECVGRGQERHVQAYFRMALISVLVLGAGFVAYCQLFPLSITQLLLEEGSLLHAETAVALGRFSLSFPFVGINITIAAYFAAREISLPSIVLSLGRGFFFAPLALFACAYLTGGTVIWYAALMAEFSCLAVSVWTLWKTREQVLPALQAEG